jgi:hypothetical protein
LPPIEAPPTTFRKKYTLEFAKLTEELCAEMVQRAEWQRQHQPASQPEAVEV